MASMIHRMTLVSSKVRSSIEQSAPPQFSEHTHTPSGHSPFWPRPEQGTSSRFCGHAMHCAAPPEGLAGSSEASQNHAAHVSHAGPAHPSGQRHPPNPSTPPSHVPLL